MKFKVSKASEFCDNPNRLTIHTMKELRDFIDKNGDIIIYADDNNDGIYELTIYDYYVE